ncbi:nucleotidyl transferase AbiEii/AbiGii toxin family protein [Marinobacter sp. LV10MA510-1]|uniref:nucleotidyl transferase AbiEii/AbiGii toxin family protein n=1 Tax=Marinobacter sp. LV10MA510-1 TaxID=1415567 RepID=UPI000BF8D857|nr:nucleotidyl transferase AbiEii/AbiGii toxin family protein [Marinobacter sp. LV10MA510-1]PFG07937.1 nucleotidyltransferase AbiEii toxin of type IV toxin-antitoxin system [Marinobacter sp. LV10MA510-1]
MSLDTSLLADVADALGIERPAIVEKDYYAVQLLKLLATIKPIEFDLVFAGGTSLAKAHQNTYRMSEDIDIKLVPKPSETDAEHLGRQHEEFLTDPRAEMLHGLACLQREPIHKERYEEFIGPLVYHESPVQWDEALQTLTDLTHQVL